MSIKKVPFHHKTDVILNEFKYAITGIIMVTQLLKKKYFVKISILSLTNPYDTPVNSATIRRDVDEEMGP